jgi:hypothetical protein
LASREDGTCFGPALQATDDVPTNPWRRSAKSRGNRLRRPSTATCPGFSVNLFRQRRSTGSKPLNGNRATSSPVLCLKVRPPTTTYIATRLAVLFIPSVNSKVEFTKLLSQAAKRPRHQSSNQDDDRPSVVHRYTRHQNSEKRDPRTPCCPSVTQSDASAKQSPLDALARASAPLTSMPRWRLILLSCLAG